MGERRKMPELKSTETLLQEAEAIEFRLSLLLEKIEAKHRAYANAEKMQIFKMIKQGKSPHEDWEQWVEAGNKTRTAIEAAKDVVRDIADIPQ